MNHALPNRTFSALNKGKHRSEMMPLPKNRGRLYLSTHFELGESDLAHFHDEPHLTFILNGGLVDKRKSRETERFSGELMFFRAGEAHQTISKTFPTKYFTLQFQTDFFKSIDAEARFESSVEKNPDSKFKMLKIYKEMSLNDEFSGVSVEMLLLDFANEVRVGKEKTPNWINKILELLNDRWNVEISLDEMAKAAGVHPKTVSKYFPKFFQCTFGEYRRRLKIEKSLALIKSSKLSLTEIAHECGFYDQSHFTAVFKDLTGFRPKEFRRFG